MIELIKKLNPFKKRKIPFYTGMIGVGEKETDYILGNTTDYKKILLQRGMLGRQPKYEYNQAAQYESRNRCTVYSAITELSYLFDYKFTFCQIKEIATRMIKDKKLDPNKGAYLSDAIDYTRRWRNENFPEEQVVSYRIDYKDKELRKILTSKAVRLTQIGYRTSIELHKELQETGVARKKDYPKVGGHAVSQYGINTIDNYKGKNKRNRYSFRWLDDLIDNGVIFRNGYLFLKK